MTIILFTSYSAASVKTLNSLTPILNYRNNIRFTFYACMGRDDVSRDQTSPPYSSDPKCGVSERVVRSREILALAILISSCTVISIGLGLFTK